MAGYKTNIARYLRVGLPIILLTGVVYLVLNFLVPNFFFKEYSIAVDDNNESSLLDDLNTNEAETILEEEVVFASHIETPDDVRAAYMTSWVAGTKSIREPLVEFIDTSALNAVVIDIKDYSGKVSFDMDSELVDSVGSEEIRIRDIEALIEDLHSRNIYIIGRVSVFQDPHLAKVWPEHAIKTASDKSVVWKDRKGLSFMDAGSKDVWDYNIEIARTAYEMGFDEINFDYIRFPSDGNMQDIYFPHSEGRAKSDVMKEFYEYVNTSLHESGIVTSADLFGMTTSNTDDLGIGQVIEHALLNFDYVCPMVYPSHYPKTWNGYDNPAAHPYGVIFKSMSDAVKRAEAIGVSKEKLRPWIQDFDLGATYTKEMVEDQIRATYDVGLDSYMSWDPSNKYTKEAYYVDLPKNEPVEVAQ